MRKFLLTALVVCATVFPAGCGKRGPVLAGGKPVGHWVQALQDPDARVRKKAVAKLRNVGPADPAVLPALVGALEDRDPHVRYEAVQALVSYGPGAEEALPALAEVQRRERNARVRAVAAQALEKLQARR